MREAIAVMDSIREVGSAHAPAYQASDVVMTRAGLAPRAWRVIDAAEASPDAGTIVPLVRWLALRAAGTDMTKVGALLAPDSNLATLRPYLGEIPVIAIHYPRFADGRGYSHARRLRHLWGYRGPLLAVGDVLRDQVIWMWRVGIDHFHLRADQDPVGAQRAFTLYSAFYQYS